MEYGLLKGTLVGRGSLIGIVRGRGRLTGSVYPQCVLTGFISSRRQLTASLSAKGSLHGIISARGRLIGKVTGVIVTADSFETYMLVCEDGTELPAVYVEDEVTFTATANDIRLGTVAASAEGVVEGTKDIPAYHTTESICLIMPGESFTIPLSSMDKYAYTKLQAIICPFNTSLTDSVAAEKISVEDNVYPVQSTEPLSVVEKDNENKSINLGITNDTDLTYLIRYFTYKEIY